MQERVTKQAVNVMDLYAKRARVERDPCKPDGPEMDEFCKGFEHQPTKDQVSNSAPGFVKICVFRPCLAYLFCFGIKVQGYQRFTDVRAVNAKCKGRQV